ncbi:unnamed protein product [Choristocarpus tenellus]
MVDKVGQSQPATEYKLEPSAEGFSATNAHYFARLSIVAYETEDIAKSELFDKLGYTDVFWLKSEDNNTQGYVAAQASHVAVVFRGTDQGADWWINLDILYKETKHGVVHKGFHTALNSLWGDRKGFEGILGTVRSLGASNPDRPIFLSGHSLGGALASIAAAQLELDVPDVSVAGVYTIGSPRVFSREYATVYDKALRARTFRAVNNNDLVARVPPILKHVGTEIYIDPRGNIGPRSWFDFFAGYWQSIMGGSITNGFDDHESELYEAAFLAAISAPVS